MCNVLQTSFLDVFFVTATEVSGWVECETDLNFTFVDFLLTLVWL